MMKCSAVGLAEPMLVTAQSTLLLKSRDYAIWLVAQQRSTPGWCGLRQCSPVRQTNAFWLSKIDQRDDRQDGATQHFQWSERHGMREEWHKPKREPSGQRAVPKKPVVSSARHGHPSNLWASPQQMPA
jgi:hypothetical protein